MKKNILHIIILCLVGFLLINQWHNKKQQEKLLQKIDEGNKMIIEMDVTTKERDGQYTKLVNHFNTQKDLNKQLKEENKDLFNFIKKQNEKLLMINNTIISLREEINQGFGSLDTEDTNLINLKLKYPNDGDNFITWDGNVNKNNAFYSGTWRFGKLPLQIILTETDRGLWRSRLIGPDWLVVDSIEINSLPLPKIEKIPNFSLVLGGGYINSFNPNMVNAVSIGGGIRFKDHRFIINLTTNNEIGFNYYYDIFKFKIK